MTPILAVGEEPPAMEAVKPARKPSAKTAMPAIKRAKKPSAKTADRFKVINAFADFTMAKLNRAEIAVWLLLWRDTRNGLARTSQAYLARRAGCCVRQVTRAIKTLRANGLLAVDYQGGLDRSVSIYRVEPAFMQDMGVVLT